METELIHLRITRKMKEDIELLVKDGAFSSLSDFIKDAARHALDEYTTKVALARLAMLKGSVKNIRRLTHEEREKIALSLTEAESNRLMKKYGLERFRI